MTFGCEMCDWKAEFGKDGGIVEVLRVCHEHYMGHSWLRRKLNSLLDIPDRARLKRFQRWTEGKCTAKKS